MSLAALRKNDKSCVLQCHVSCPKESQKIQDLFCLLAMTCDEHNLPKIVKFNALAYLKLVHANGVINVNLSEKNLLFYCLRLASKLFRQQNDTLSESWLQFLRMEEKIIEFEHFQNYFKNYFNQKLELLSTPYEFINLAFLRNAITEKEKCASKAIVDFSIIYVQSMFKSAEQIAQSSMKLARNGFNLTNCSNMISSL